MKENFFSPIADIIKSNSQVRISKNTKELLNQICIDLVIRIAEISNRLTLLSGRKTVSARTCFDSLAFISFEPQSLKEIIISGVNKFSLAKIRRIVLSFVSLRISKEFLKNISKVLHFVLSEISKGISTKTFNVKNLTTIVKSNKLLFGLLQPFF